MPKTVDATRLKAMLNDGAELALLDVREEGQFGVAHMLYAIPLPTACLKCVSDSWSHGDRPGPCS